MFPASLLKYRTNKYFIQKNLHLNVKSNIIILVLQTFVALLKATQEY